MKDLISLIIYFPNEKKIIKSLKDINSNRIKVKSYDFLETLRSLLNQSHSNVEILLFTKNKKNKDFFYSFLYENDFFLNTIPIKIKKSILFLRTNNKRIKIISLNEKFTLKNIMIKSLNICSGDFICPIYYRDFIDYNRFKNQLITLKSRNLNICSSVIFPIFLKNNKNSYDEKSNRFYLNCTDANKFLHENEIDFACKSYYIPVDFFSLMIRKKFFVSLLPILKKKDINSPLEFILFFLSYCKIKKTKTSITYIRNNRLPYKENLNLISSADSKNLINKFNKFNFIDNRNYLLSSLKYQFLSEEKRLNENNLINCLFIVDELNLGGTETFILSLCKNIKNFNINPIILTYGGLLEDLFILNNIEIYKNTYDLSDKSKFIRKFLISKKIDLIMIHGPKEINSYFEIIKNIKLPKIGFIHGNFYSYKEVKILFDYFDRVIFVSKESSLFYKKYTHPKTEILQNSINIHNKKYKYSNYQYINNEIKSIYCLIEKNKKIISYCSRLSYGKGKLAFYFLKNLQKLLEENFDIYVLILGNGTEFEKIKNYANSLNFKFGKRIFMLSSIFDVKFYFANSFLVVGTGRVALEALSISTPVLSLGLTGYNGIICEENKDFMIDSNFGDHGHKENCFLKENKLYEDIKFLINNPNLLYKLKIWSKNFIYESLNAKNITLKLYNLILYCLKNQ